jgi:hypothetical protein
LEASFSSFDFSIFAFKVADKGFVGEVSSSLWTTQCLFPVPNVPGFVAEGLGLRACPSLVLAFELGERNVALKSTVWWAILVFPFWAFWSKITEYISGVSHSSWNTLLGAGWRFKFS